MVVTFVGIVGWICFHSILRHSFGSVKIFHELVGHALPSVSYKKWVGRTVGQIFESRRGSDYVTNTYGQSWNSPFEKSRVPGHNQWVPVQKRSPELKMLGPLLRTEKNVHLWTTATNHMNMIFDQKNLHIDRSFFGSYGRHATNYFASLGIFVRQGRRTQRQQNHLRIIN